MNRTRMNEVQISYTLNKYVPGSYSMDAILTLSVEDLVAIMQYCYQLGYNRDIAKAIQSTQPKKTEGEKK